MPSPLIFIFTSSLLFPFAHFSSIPLNFDGIREFSDPSQKSDLPLAANPKIFNETSWSTYRPQCYFGLKNRRPDSPMFGLIWYQQREKAEKGQINLRHWAMHEDNIVFMWHKHNGRSFGSQQIIDGDFEMKTEWFNFGSSSWMARLNLTRPKWGNGPKALILYLALQDEISSFENNSNLNGKNGEINFLEGKSPAVGGKFSMKIQKMNGNWDISKLALNFEPFLDMAKVGEIIE